MFVLQGNGAGDNITVIDIVDGEDQFVERLEVQGKDINHAASYAAHIIVTKYTHLARMTYVVRTYNGKAI